MTSASRPNAEQRQARVGAGHAVVDEQVQRAPEQRQQHAFRRIRRHVGRALRLGEGDHAHAAADSRDRVDDLEHMRPQRRAFLLRGKGEAEIACAAGDQQQPGDDGCHAEQRVIRAEQLFKRHAFLLAQRRGKYAVQHGAQHEEHSADPYPRTACRRQTAVNVKAVQQMQRAQADAGNCAAPPLPAAEASFYSFGRSSSKKLVFLLPRAAGDTVFSIAHSPAVGKQKDRTLCGPLR